MLNPTPYRNLPVTHKGWGHEVLIHNSPLYCAKILMFRYGGKFSFHYHIKKTETWYVNKGQFELRHLDTDRAMYVTQYLTEGDVVHIPVGNPHQLYAPRGGEIFEASTQCFDEDNYRIEAGDSQS